MTGLMQRFLTWASEAEKGRGFAINKRASRVAHSAVRQGYGDIYSAAGLDVFVISDSGREAIRAIVEARR